MNFIIYAPDYTHRSAGVRALHRLAELLNVFGEHCFITGRPKPGSKIPIMLQGVALERPVVGIYPEIVGGNPFDADVVVRWMLNVPGRANSDTTSTWGPKDIKVGWLPQYADQVLRVPVIDRSIFHNDENPFDHRRKGAMVYCGKANAHGVPVPDYGPNLANLVIPTELLGWLLRYIETLYVCEESTIADEARACGCEVKYVLSDYLPEEPGQSPEPTNAQTEAMVSSLIERCRQAASVDPMSRLGWKQAEAA
mgnify:CR=1 FL=1